MFTCLLCLSLSLCAGEICIDPEPAAAIINPCPRYSLINSVDYHPHKNLFSVIPTEVILSPKHLDQHKPHGIAISPCGNFLAIYDLDSNRQKIHSSFRQIIQGKKTGISRPEVLQNLLFPHGIAFSSDGSFLLVTQFGSIHTSRDGNIAWNKTTPPNQSKVDVYKINISGLAPG